MAKLEVVVLAAGQGTRMKSNRPKVLHRLGGKPLLAHVVDAAKSIGAYRIHVVYGHGGDQVRAEFAGVDINWVLQDQQNGTGHAVRMAMPNVDDDSTVLALFGDVPLINTETLKRAVEIADSGSVSVVTTLLDNPLGYGRILRGASGNVLAIREQKDASPDEQAIKEINSGIKAAPSELLKKWLDALQPNNAQGELYLTDIVESANNDDVTVEAVLVEDTAEVTGVNDRAQLASLERVYQSRKVHQLMVNGASVADPTRVDVRGNVVVGQDVFIDVNVIFEGEVTIGDDCTIGPNCVIRESSIGAGTHVHANSLVDGASVGEGASIGPFARLRPETNLGRGVKIGNFVEVKKANFSDGAKANHLTYVGDSDIGARVNIGAGTITCNYDGANKHRTVIGDDAFIGSGTELVAPVTVGAGATIGAGSTIGSDAPAQQLTLTRVKQRSVKGWKRPVKKK